MFRGGDFLNVFHNFIFEEIPLKIKKVSKVPEVSKVSDFGRGF